MTRATLLRLLVAIRFGVRGNAACFRWLLPKSMKLPNDWWFWNAPGIIAGQQAVLEDYIFRKTPLIPMLRTESVPCGGGTYIQDLFIYADR